jgi:hypothetical protein
MEMAILPTLTSMPMVFCPLATELSRRAPVGDGERADDELEKVATSSRRVCCLSVFDPA